MPDWPNDRHFETKRHFETGRHFETNTQPFSQTDQMIEWCCDYLSVQLILLYVIIMSRASFRMNPHSIAWLNVKELLARIRCQICLKESNDIRSHNHFVRQGTINHLAKVAKWLSCLLSTYLYGAFDIMLLSCHVRVSEWTNTLLFAWMPGNSLLQAGAISHVWKIATTFEPPTTLYVKEHSTI